MILRGGSGTEFIPDISEDNLPVAVCALLVAIKEKQYREKSLLFLNQMIPVPAAGQLMKVPVSSPDPARRRTDLPVAEPRSLPRQGLREPCAQRHGLPPPRLHPTHAATALQSITNLSDGL